MTSRQRQQRTTLATLVCVCCVSVASYAQDEPWQVRVDPLTNIECALINASNAEFAALASTGELVLLGDEDGDVTDTIIVGSFVDADGNVFLGDALAGQVRFAEDSTDLTTLWWLDTETDLVFEFDTQVELPFRIDATPDLLIGEVCDPCVLWDFDTFCEQPPTPSPITIIFCGGNTMAMMMVTFAGFVAIRSTRRIAAPRSSGAQASFSRSPR